MQYRYIFYGKSGIRTHGDISATLDFESSALDQLSHLSEPCSVWARGWLWCLTPEMSSHFWASYYISWLIHRPPCTIQPIPFFTKNKKLKKRLNETPGAVSYTMSAVCGWWWRREHRPAEERAAEFHKVVSWNTPRADTRGVFWLFVFNHL